MEQSKNKNRFNFIDLILLVVLLSALAILIYNLVEKKLTVSSSETVQVEYTVSVKAMSDELRDYVQSSIGQSITEMNVNRKIGEISNVYCSPAQYVGSDSMGNQIKTDYSGKIDSQITVTALATKTKTGYSVNGIDLVLGGELHIRTSRLEAVGEISSIKIKGAA